MYKYGDFFFPFNLVDSGYWNSEKALDFSTFYFLKYSFLAIIKY